MSKDMKALEKKLGNTMGEFKRFILKGNIIDMAVGVIIGGAFSKIVTSLVNDILMPALGAVTGGASFNTLKYVIRPAVLDGAGPLSLFFQVIMPMLKPVLFTCFILQFMGVWSDFLTPLYLSSKSKLFPMTMAVYQFFGQNTNYWNYIFADIVLTCIPVILVYLIGQKYIIGGLTSGAVKE